jgi:SAM-dependent methyltransferase
METGTIGLDGRSAWDLFGDALEEFHRQGCSPPYYWQRSDGTQTAESIEHYFAPFTGWNAQERAAFALLDGHVLDAGSGAGKHALELQQRGVPVVAIDVSPAAVRVCRARGVRDVREMSLFDRGFEPASFDSAALFTNNLSLGGTPDGIARLLDALGRVLTAHGRIVLTNLDVAGTASAADLAYLQENRRNGRLPGQIRMRAEYDGRCGPWMDWLFVSVAELEHIGASAGWRLADVVDCGGPYAAVLRR